MDVYISGIEYSSMVDGDGLRTTIFFSGCSVGCKGCHNKKFWDKFSGQKYDTKVLVKNVSDLTPTKRITFSGGEPMEQKTALKKLINLFEGFDIGLYTSYELDQVDADILEKLSFIKTGKFIEKLKVKDKYFGSSNQKFIYLNNGGLQYAK